ncbi:MAG: hypothetical protein RIC81_08760, partial [Microcella pacifica]|uniref:hypothetical protein n=1 Tax=Microcella pacifica TaxID=2591847 RepID=UPI003314DD8D
AAIRAFGTPSAANLRINAQSSKVITLQSSSVHFSSVDTVQFSSVVDSFTQNGRRVDNMWSGHRVDAFRVRIRELSRRITR